MYERPPPPLRLPTDSPQWQPPDDEFPDWQTYSKQLFDEAICWLQENWEYPAVGAFVFIILLILMIHR